MSVCTWHPFGDTSNVHLTSKPCLGQTLNPQSHRLPWQGTTRGPVESGLGIKSRLVHPGLWRVLGFRVSGLGFTTQELVHEVLRQKLQPYLKDPKPYVFVGCLKNPIRGFRVITYTKVGF